MLFAFYGESEEWVVLVLDSLNVKDPLKGE